MDPLTLIGLTAAALAVMSDGDRQRAEAEANEAMSRALLGLSRWHFALSWDWDPFQVTVTAPNLSVAVDQLVAEGHYSRKDSRFRIYGAIRGGKVVGYNDVVPTIATVHSVWQAEQEINIVTIETPSVMSRQGIEELSWEQTGEGIKGVAEYIGYFPPDLVVQGGIVEYRGSL